MEGIIALLIIIAGIIGSLNKSKKVVQNRPGQGTQPPAQKPVSSPGNAVQRPVAPPTPAPAQPATPDKAGQKPMPSLQDLLQSFLEGEVAPPSPAQPKTIPEAQSAADEKGCVGGSLPHSGTSLHEGETVKKMPPRLEFKHPDTSANFEVQHSCLRVSAEDMRRAVVMAEILGKPKALRPRSDRP